MGRFAAGPRTFCLADGCADILPYGLGSRCGTLSFTDLCCSLFTVSDLAHDMRHSILMPIQQITGQRIFAGEHMPKTWRWIVATTTPTSVSTIQMQSYRRQRSSKSGLLVRTQRELARSGV